MIKAILKIVCVLVLITNAANAQSDSTIIGSVESQTKGIENNTITSVGEVIEADVTTELDLSTVYLQIIDEKENDIYLTSSNDDAGFNQLPKISDDLVGKTVKATYTKGVEREVVEYRPAELPEGVANRGKEVDPTITVYTIKGTQEFVTQLADGWEISFRTQNGVKMTFLADEMVFNGHSPLSFNDKEIRISYLEFESFNLQELEIVD